MSSASGVHTAASRSASCGFRLTSAMASGSSSLHLLIYLVNLEFFKKVVLRHCAVEVPWQLTDNWARKDKMYSRNVFVRCCFVFVVTNIQFQNAEFPHRRSRFTSCRYLQGISCSVSWWTLPLRFTWHRAPITSCLLQGHAF